MSIIFKEDFKVTKGKYPASWEVEFNGSLKLETLIAGEGSLEMLSAGNRFMPLIQEVTDCVVRMNCEVGFDPTRNYIAYIQFRYDPVLRRGEAVRFNKIGRSEKLLLEYGTVVDNDFTSLTIGEFSIDEVEFASPFDLELELNGKKGVFKFNGRVLEFRTLEPKAGRVGIGRGHFFDLMRINRFFVESGEAHKALSEKSFRLMLPREPLIDEIYCDVTLSDFGHYIEATLSIGGGTHETEAGEGSYHAMRMDMITNPYFKVITANSIEKYTLFKGFMLLVVESLAPSFFYGAIWKKPEWPLVRKVRFVKPESEFVMAVGADRLANTVLPNQAQKFSETISDTEGNELYSGQGITEGAAKIEFFSHPDKQIIQRIPKDDPRYAQAVTFAERNHYFSEGEKLDFRIEITRTGSVPTSCSLMLEDAFFRPLADIDCKCFSSSTDIGLRQYEKLICTTQLSKLKPGVYHLRMISEDPTVSLEDYCAFEIMSSDISVPAPPLLSGLPYIYSARTETRGLMTDAFDPWRPGCVNEGHYISGTVYLPKCGRDCHVAPVLKTYGREWFLWPNDRCADKHTVEENLDLIAECDQVNLVQDIDLHSIMYFQYSGAKLRYFVRFAELTGDPDYDIPALKKLVKTGGKLDKESFILMAKKHFAEWLEFSCQALTKATKERIHSLRKITGNSKLKHSAYGPAHIYAGRYKGPEFLLCLGTFYMSHEYVDYWQFEDYPETCRYPAHRGSFFMASALLTTDRKIGIYPEIYTAGLQGCPDGAVFFAHPPFGIRRGNPPVRLKKRICEYVYGTAYFRDGAFSFWNKYGFQLCGCARDRFEVFLKEWGKVDTYKPARPKRGPAYVYSRDSWENNQERTLIYCGERNGIQTDVIDVRKTCSEFVPFVAETFRNNHGCAGFQVQDMEIAKLSPEDVGVLVLPPLKGMKPEVLEAIRSLHKGGVSLLAAEDVTGLEDIFGVRNTGQLKRVENIHGTSGFLSDQTEYVSCEECTGKYVSDNAEVLIDGEIPVLLRKRNGSSEAVLFNVPPTTVGFDRIPEKCDCYGRDVISELILRSVEMTMSRLADPDVTSTDGYIAACICENACEVVIVENIPDSDSIEPVITIRTGRSGMNLKSCDSPCAILKQTENCLKLRLRIEAEDTAFIVLN